MDQSKEKIKRNYLHLKNELKHFPETKLIIVTKGREISDIEILLKEGHRDFGENKIQETVKKYKCLKNNYPELILHFIGRIQKNKVKTILENVDYVHSLYRFDIAQMFSQLIIQKNKKCSFFIQINFENEPQKGGILPEELGGFLKKCKNELSLNIIGLMTIPPRANPAQHYFRELKKLAEKNALPELSMGMSHDYKEALLEEATYIRVGSFIFQNEKSRNL